MTVRGPYEIVHRYLGLSTDTKPTTASVGDEFFETNTRLWYVYNGSSWSQKITSAVGGGAYTAVTDPAGTPTFAAVTTAIVDAYSGVIVTLTGAGNAQTIQNPTVITAGKTFTVVNNDTSTNSIVVNGITIAAGKAQSFIWDGTAWGVTDVGITALPVTLGQGGTGQTTAQLAINALTAVAGAAAEHVLTKDTTTGNAIFKAAASAFDPASPGAIGGTTPAAGTFTDLAGNLTDVTVGSTRDITVAEMKGQLHNYTGAYTGSLPTCADGLHCNPFSSTAVAISVDVKTGTDVFVLNGVAQAAGNKITSDGTIDAEVYIKAVNIAGVWKYIATSIQGIWIDGGA